MSYVLYFPDAKPLIEGLSWIKGDSLDLVNAVSVAEGEGQATEELEQQVVNLYSFFKWQALTNMCQFGTREHWVARAFLMKYSRRIFRQELLPMEEQEIQEAERRLKESNAEIKRRKAEQ